MDTKQSEPTENRRYKMKKRQSGKKSRFLIKAKKFGKQGKLGHGFEVDSATYDYFLRIMEIGHKNEFDSPEDKDIFIANAFSETENKEVNLSSNQMISRVLESLLPLADANVICRFTSAFTPNFRTICFDPFASHILENLLVVTYDKWMKHKELKEWFRNTCKYILNNFEEFVFNNFANRIMRKVCQCLSGTVSECTKTQKQFTPARNLKKGQLKEAEAELPNVKKARKKNTEILKDFAKRFFNWPQFYDLFKIEVTGGFVQCLLRTLKAVDEEILNEGIIQTTKAIPAPIDLENKGHLHVLEICLTVANDITYEHLMNKYYKGKLLTFGIHVKGNFTLRRIINNAPNEKIFESVFEEIEDEFSKIYQADYTSIFVALAEGCKKFKAKQSIFVKKLAEVLESKSDENFVFLLTRFGKTFKPKDDGTVSFITDINGTMVLQHLYGFHKPHKVVSNILDFDEIELLKLVLDPKGSHVMDSYFQSSTVGDKNKEKMLLKLKEHLVPMACSKFGSRVLDTMWKTFSLKNKSVVAEALCERESQLNSNQFGKFLSIICALHLYKRDKKLWEKAISQGTNRKLEAENLLAALGINGEPCDDQQQDNSISKKKKKKRVETEEEEIIPTKPEQVEAEEDEQQLVQDNSISKKKKKKRVETEEEEIIPTKPEQVEAEEDEQQLVQDNSISKKKKKRKVETDEEIIPTKPKKLKKSKKEKVEDNE